MKQNILKMIVFFAITFSSVSVFAQGMSGYKLGIGLRGGNESGITIKYFFKDNAALEGIISRSWGYGGFRLTGLYEVHKPIPGVDNLDWYYGGGAHIGSYKSSYYGYTGLGNGYFDSDGNWHPSGYKANYMTLGIDGIIGLEYQFTEFPFSVSLDIKPYFDFVGRSNRYTDGAFSVRYTLK